MGKGHPVKWVGTDVQLASHQFRSVTHVFSTKPTYYLDEFVVVGKPQVNECDEALGTALSSRDNLGCPTVLDKQEGPATCIGLLGITMDTGAQELRMPAAKLERLQALIVKWRPTEPRHSVVVRCIRELGMCSSMGPRMVPVPME